MRRQMVRLLTPDKYAATKYTRAGQAMAFADLREGARVVVTTTGEGDDRTATLVRISSATAKSTAKASPAHQHQH